jgi:hypothetical protein
LPGKRQLSQWLRRLVWRVAGLPSLRQSRRPAKSRTGLPPNTQRNATVVADTGIANGPGRIAADRRVIASAAHLIVRAPVASIVSESNEARDLKE